MKNLCKEGGIDEENLWGFAPQPWPRRLRVSALRDKNLTDSKWTNSTTSPKNFLIVVISKTTHNVL
jgi:hypothetical protein